MDIELPWAEDKNYWKSSTSSPGTWLRKAEAEIEKIGGKVSLQAKGNHLGASAYLIEFSVGIDKFRAMWPVLPSKGGNTLAAERQAATMLYHDVKGRILKVSIFGYRFAFFDFMILPNGQTAGQLSGNELIGQVAGMLPPAR